MGKSILTPKQLNFLELAQAQPSITKRFYLTGGTALSEFYLHHRLSEDIDLFSEQEVSIRVVESFLKKVSPKLKVSKIVKQNFLGLFTYILHFEDGSMLKIDFNNYPFPQIEKGKAFGKLEVSSVYDIAVNKIHTISMKPRTRDYIDLYFIFNKTEYTPQKYLNKMRLDSQAKFDWPLEPKNLVAALLRVKDIQGKDFPRMVVPFDPHDMEKFFLKLVKNLEKEIFL